MTLANIFSHLVVVGCNNLYDGNGRKDGKTERQKDRKTERQKDEKTERPKKRKKEGQKGGGHGGVRVVGVDHQNF